MPLSKKLQDDLDRKREQVHLARMTGKLTIEKLEEIYYQNKPLTLPKQNSGMQS